MKSSVFICNFYVKVHEIWDLKMTMWNIKTTIFIVAPFLPKLGCFITLSTVSLCADTEFEFCYSVGFCLPSFESCNEQSDLFCILWCAPHCSYLFVWILLHFYLSSLLVHYILSKEWIEEVLWGKACVYTTFAAVSCDPCDHTVVIITAD